MTGSPTIRSERPGDAEGIRAVHLAAFEGAVEAGIVDRIRDGGGPRLSLVAEAGSELIGHILFSELTVGEERRAGTALGPMAVLPAHQRRGVGSALVRRGLELLRAGGCPFVVVLGHPEYYPRFGFVPASRHGILSEYPGVPDEAFMVLESSPGGLRDVAGVARYRCEFAAEE